VKKISFPSIALAGLLAMPPVQGWAQDDEEAGTNGELLTFTHVLDDSELGVLTPRANETFTPAVEEFHATGENPYKGDDAVAADGRRLYQRWCQACHLPDGSGRIGPSLIDDTHRRERAATDKGEFEIIYGGSAGAMQAFGGRIDQDDILKLMAFVDTLRAE
jgi:cytochrome c-L